MNILQVAGHLGADAETRFTQGGQKVTTLRLATNSKKGGKEETTWWKATIWGDRFDKMLPYLKKGSSVIIMGELGKPQIYTDKEGNPQVSLDITVEIIKFSPFGRGSSSSENLDDSSMSSSQSQYSYGSAPRNNSFNSEMDSFKDDQLPF
jgi:single-strand DNA-binding protein